MSEELAKRAVACKHWRWVPGMLSNHGARYLGANCWIDASAARAVYADAFDGEVPNLTDPATIGCLLALVREAWGSPHIGLLWFEADDGLHVCSVTRERADLWESVRIVAEASTEAAALVAALEAAP